MYLLYYFAEDFDSDVRQRTGRQLPLVQVYFDKAVVTDHRPLVKLDSNLNQSADGLLC